MKIPRDLAGSDLAKALRELGYETTRQTGSHVRLTTLAGAASIMSACRCTKYFLSELSGRS